MTICFKTIFLVCLAYAYEGIMAFNPWLKILQESQSEKLCLLSSDSDDQVEVKSKEIFDNNYATLVTNDVDVLFVHCDISIKSTIILYHQEPDQIVAALTMADQDQLSKNVWIIELDQATVDEGKQMLQGMTRKFGLRIQVFILSLNSMELEQVVGTATEHLEYRRLGQLSQVSLTQILLETRSRMDFQGASFRANYVHQPPFAIVMEKDDDNNRAELAGTLADTIKIFAAHVNLTLEFVSPKPENINVWGVKQSDGSFNGMISEVAEGIVDVSVAGFTITQDRAEIVNFPPLYYRSQVDMIIQTPDDNEAGFFYHTIEFTKDAWISLAIFYAGCYAIVTSLIFCIRNTTKAEHSILSTITDSFALCSRAFISKGSSLSYPRTSYRIATFAIFFMGMIVLLSYRGLLNASLNVRVVNIPIQTWEDVLASDKDLLLFQGTSIEAIFSQSPEGSLKKQIYDNKINAIDSSKHLNKAGAEESAKQVLSGNAMLYAQIEPYVLLDSYPCGLRTPGNLNFAIYTQLAFPFHKDSPFLDIFNEFMYKHFLSGLMDSVKRDYEVTAYQNGKCGAMRNPMGFEQTVLPFTCLILGIAVCLVVGLCERIRLWPRKKAIFVTTCLKCSTCGYEE